MKTQNPLGYEKESKLLVNFAIPCIISMLVTSLYNIVDQIFIGQGIGMLGNAATNIAFPLSTTCTALSLLLGIGSATNFSLHLGAGEKEKSARYAGNGIFLMAVFGLCLFLATTLFLTPMLKFFGATTEVLPYARQYTRITAFGFPFLIANTGMSKLILADGSPRYSMISMLIGAIVNTILDPIFIFGLHLGMTGAALATLFSQAVSAILVIRALMKPEEMYQLEPKKIRLHRFLLFSILTIGLPAGFQSMMYNIANIIIQSSLNHLGTDAIAAYTAFGKMDAFYWMISGAFSVSIATFVGQNYGAGKYSRMKRSVTVCLLMDLAASLLVSLILIFFGNYLFRLFTQDAGVIKVGMEIISLLAPSYVLFIFIEIFSSALRGIGDVMIPMLMTCGGVCVLRILWIFFVVPHFSGIQIILMCYPISWGVTSILFIIYYYIRQKQFFSTHKEE